MPEAAGADGRRSGMAGAEIGVNAGQGLLGEEVTSKVSLRPRRIGSFYRASAAAFAYLGSRGPLPPPTPPFSIFPRCVYVSRPLSLLSRARLFALCPLLSTHPPLLFLNCYGHRQDQVRLQQEDPTYVLFILNFAIARFRHHVDLLQFLLPLVRCTRCPLYPRQNHQTSLPRPLTIRGLEGCRRLTFISASTLGSLDNLVSEYRRRFTSVGPLNWTFGSDLHAAVTSF